MYLSGYNRSIILPHLAQRQVAQRQVWPGVQEVSVQGAGGIRSFDFSWRRGGTTAQLRDVVVCLGCVQVVRAKQGRQA